MPLFTARLTDQEYDAFKALTAGRPMVELLRRWIAQGEPAAYTAPETGTLGLVDTQVDKPVDTVDTSTSRPSRIVPESELPPLTGVSGALIDTHGSADSAGWTPKPRHQMPPFLAAPDDDCSSCGHDRQGYHLDGACRMPTGPRVRCGCPAFVDPAEPF